MDATTLSESEIMNLLHGSKKLLLSLAGGGASTAVLFGLSNDRSTAKAASLLPNSFSDQFTPVATKCNTFTSGVDWVENWDNRQPEFYIKAKFGLQPHSDDDKELIEKPREGGFRHLILIRHGQYNLQGKEDSERYLTDLGREQAKYAGLRLKELGLPYTRLVQSTMTRAKETAGIISKELSPDLKIESCDFLREGTPCDSNPKLVNWKPDPKVSSSTIVCFLFQANLFDNNLLILTFHCRKCIKTVPGLKQLTVVTFIAQTLNKQKILMKYSFAMPM